MATQTQILGKVAIVSRGEYDSLTIYNKLDVVTFGGSSYLCNVDNTRGILPTNVNYWTVLAKRGDDGYTPVPGVDYNTPEDKAEMKEMVITDITPILKNKADKSEIPDVSDFITKDVNNLTYYELKTNTGSLISMSLDSTTYVMTLQLKNSDGTVISTQTVDLPLETVVVSGRYDSETKKVILTLQNGTTIEFSVADLVAGLQQEITSTNKLASDLVDDTNSGNKFVTTTEKQTWNAKGTYSKPIGGIPKSDLETSVQSSLGKADTALQSITSANVTNALGYTPYDSSNPQGYTNNKGTITGITMNGASKGTSGVVDLGTVITQHQDISGKVNKSSFVYDGTTETLTITIS